MTTADHDGDSDDQQAEGNLELFFDLVFVFAMSQVTRLMLSVISWHGAEKRLAQASGLERAYLARDA